MSKEKLGQEPAFPDSYHYNKNGEDCVQVRLGMSKRLYLAGMAMQGLLANPELATIHNIEWVAEHALMQADLLLRKEIE